MLRIPLAFVLGLCALAAHASSLDAVREKLAARAPDALATAEALTRSEARNAQAWLLLAQAQMMARDFAAAVKSAERAARLDRNHAGIQYALGNAYGANINNVGMLSKMSYAGRIRDAFARAVELNPDHHEARMALMQFYLQAPGIAGGSMARAEEHAAILTERHPGRGHWARGLLLESAERHEEAIAALRQALAIDPSLRGAHYRLGQALQRAERWDEAFEAYAALVDAHPDEHAAWFAKGRTAAVSGVRLDEGLAALERYESLSNGEGPVAQQHVHFRRGNIHEKAGRRDLAAEAYRAALALAPDFEDARKALCGLGLAC
jgi:tetratricopeptide (TPR) repeat protein